VVREDVDRQRVTPSARSANRPRRRVNRSLPGEAALRTVRYLNVAAIRQIVMLRFSNLDSLVLECHSERDGIGHVAKPQD
jgi:hypothetical protein